MKHTLSLALGASALLVGTAERADAQTLATELVQAGLSRPLYVTSPAGDFDRLFVVEQAGRIKIIKNGVLLPTPFLDITGIVGGSASGGDERGLLGLAFHPDYANNGRFFVNFTNNSGNTRVFEYAVSAGDPDIADSTVVQTIVAQSQPFTNHNGGCIQFGPDGMLYVGHGDGGSGNDPQGRAQNPLVLLGKMLRLDVDIPSPFVPADNPFVGNASVSDEIWGIGLRNPWRFSFDMGNGDLYIGDVGQFAVEEVSYVPAPLTGGLNFGWRCMEGDNCTGLSGCTCNDNALTDPVHTYGHGLGCSITGGFVYRSDEIPSLQGTYFFGDYCSDRIWSFRMAGGTVTEFTERTAELDPPGALAITSIPSFGQDAAGNVYICDFNGGEIFKIVAGCNTDPYCTAATNSTGNGATISSSGLPSISGNAFDLEARDVPANVFGLFFYGPTQIQTSFGDGFRCVGGMTFRLQPNVQANGLGGVFRNVDFGAPPVNAGAGMLNAGDTWNFQLWYRDPMGPGGTGFNLTNGLSVTFCP